VRHRFPPTTQARWLGWAVAFGGAATVTSALVPQWRDRLAVAERLLTPQGTQLAAGTAALVGIVLVLIGRGVAQRRRLALYAAVGLLSLATLAHLADGLNVETAAITAGLGSVLVWRRHVFVVPVQPARLAQLVRLASTIAVIYVGYGAIGYLAYAKQVRPGLTPGRLAVQIGARLVGMDGPLSIAGRFGRWFPASLTVLGIATLALLLLLALAPLANVRVANGERAEVARLVDRPDGDTLDPFALRRDKQWIFSDGRRAALAYRVVRGVALASGDPVGDPTAFASALRNFLDQCDRTGCRPALVGVRQDRMGLYRSFGLHTMYIGDEAIVDVDGFGLAGRQMRNVRQAVNRSHNAGVRTETLLEGELDAEVQQALPAIAAAQRGNDPDFGFLMALGDLATGRYPDCLITLARDRTGRPTAFQRYARCQAGAALSLDAMRRLPGCPNGVNEHMIVDTIGWAREHGVHRVSLNFAAFRALLEATASQPGQAVESWIARRLQNHLGIQIDSLWRFNAKFQPQWTPRHLAYRSAVDLPAIALAVLSAEGFLPFDPGRGGADPETAVPAAAGAHRNTGPRAAMTSLAARWPDCTAPSR
jgi:lysyl-tRNA synthetase, class II